MLIGSTTDTGQPVFLPFRMSCFVMSNLVVTAGMLTPNLGVRPLSSPQYTPLTVTVARNVGMANNQSVFKRSYKQRKCQQI